MLGMISRPHVITNDNRHFDGRPELTPEAYRVCAHLYNLAWVGEIKVVVWRVRILFVVDSPARDGCLLQFSDDYTVEA